MSNLFKRISNLWKLSEIKVEEDRLVFPPSPYQTVVETPKMAQIIRMKDPVKNIIEDK